MNVENPTFLSYEIKGNKITITDHQFRHPLHENAQEIITGAKEMNCLIFAIQKSMVDFRKRLEIKITFRGQIEIQQDEDFDQTDTENFMSYVGEEFQMMLQQYPAS